MSWLKLMFSMSWQGTVLNLAQSVLTYQTSVYVIGFLVMVKEGEKQQMTFRWNSIRSIHITAAEKGQRIDLYWACCTWNVTCKIDVSCLDLPVISPHFLFLPGLCNSWAVCFCTSRCKYALLSDCHLPYWPTPAHSLQATTISSLHPTLQR